MRPHAHFGTGRVERVRGTFRTLPAEREEGEAVARSVCIELVELVARPARARSLWHGSFELPDDASMRSSGVYRLELEDGRCGIAIVTRFRSVNGAMVGSFRGSSPLQETDR